MQFSARVGGSSACVRVQKSRLEWSLVGRQWIIQMAPMTSITTVTYEPGRVKSSLIVSTIVGAVEFRIEPGIGDEARALILRLVSEADQSQIGASEMLPVNQGTTADELINMKWMFDAGAADSFDFKEVPARLMGF